MSAYECISSGCFKDLSEAGVEIDKNTRNNWQSWKEENPNGIVAFRVKDSNNNPIWKDPKEAEKYGLMGNPFMGWLNNGDKATDTKYFDRWLKYGETQGNSLATEELRQVYIKLIKKAAKEKGKVLYYTFIPPAQSHAAVIGYYIQNPFYLDEDA